MELRRRRQSFAILVGLVAALTIASSAAGASTSLSIRQQGVSAIAQRLDCGDNGDGTLSCTSELVAAFKGTLKISGSSNSHTDQVCYERVDATVDADTGELIDATGETGCALDTGKVRVRSLRSIELRSTGIDLVSFTCDEFDCTEGPGGHATVRGTWSSAGKPLVSRQRFRIDDGICTEIAAAQARVREASFRGFVNGTQMVPDTALVGSGSFRIKLRCLDGLP